MEEVEREESAAMTIGRAQADVAAAAGINTTEARDARSTRRAEPSCNFGAKRGWGTIRQGAASPDRAAS